MAVFNWRYSGNLLSKYIANPRQKVTIKISNGFQLDAIEKFILEIYFEIYRKPKPKSNNNGFFGYAEIWICNLEMFRTS